MLRFDGLYISSLPVDYGPLKSYEYLRFYEDGTVIESSIQGDRSVENKSWFDKTDSTIQSGCYAVDGSSLSFSVRSPAGVVEF